MNDVVARRVRPFLPLFLALALLPGRLGAAVPAATIAAAPPSAAGAPAAPSAEARLLQARLQPELSRPGLLVLDAASLPRAVATFYADRGWAPAWDASRLQVLTRALEDLEGDGLDPADYGLPALRALAGATDPAQVAEREWLATRGCLLALLHLYRGRTDPRQLDAHWNFTPRQLEPQRALREVAQGVADNRIDELFDLARPAWGFYDRLRIALAQLRRLEAAGGWPLLAAGAPLKPGMADVRVPVLRERMVRAGLLAAPGAATLPPSAAAPAAPAVPAAAGAGPAPEQVYDEALAQAVRRFQREANLEADGAVGPATRTELNVPVATRIAQLRANLERVRWFQNELASEVVIVDIAGYRILYLRNGEVAWQSRVQVGREYRPSPVFQSAITYLTLSPAWVVPPTILKEDALPAIRRNRGYLARHRLHVYREGKQVAPSSVNWARPGNIQLRQEPGEEGALGEVVIRFDNPFSVYLHDTPHKEFFDRSRRATSSGCIRVENVHDLAVLLLDDPVNWSRQKLQDVINTRATRKVPLPRPVTILLGYWTAQVSPDGYVAFRPDIYHRDAPLVAALEAPLPAAR